MRLLQTLTLALVSASVVLATVMPAKRADLPPLSKEVLNDLRRLNPNSYQVATGGIPGRLQGVQTRCTRDSCFGLTFDDGPDEYHEIIANTVHQAGHNATFFVNGNNFGCIYDEENVKRLRHSYKQGHSICSHTWSHPHLITLNAEQIEKQLKLVETALWRILGMVPACFRAPYGETNELVLQVLRKNGYVIHGWTADSGDSADPEASVQAQLNIYRRTSPGQGPVILQHETKQRTATQVLPQALNIIRQKGFHNVQGVGRIFRYKDYKIRHGPQQKRNPKTWTCEGKPGPGEA